MGLWDDVCSVASDVVHGAEDLASDVANVGGDLIEGAGNLVGGAMQAAGQLGGLIGGALGGIGSMLEQLGAGPLGQLFPVLGIASSIAGKLVGGLGDVVKVGSQALQEAGAIPKFAGKEINSLVHTVTQQLTGGAQTDPKCDAAVNQQWGGQISDILDGIKNNFVDNCSNGKDDHKKSWIDFLVDGLKQAVGKAFSDMQDAETKVTQNGGGQDPTALLDFQKTEKFFELTMTTATQSITGALDAAKETAKAAA